MLVPLVLSVLCPCASLENYFEQTLIQFLPYDPLINFLYSRIFPLVVLSTAFILRRGLIDGSEARLISCWNRYCTLEGRFTVVKAEFVFSIEEVLRWGLVLNLGDGEEKGDVFGEILDLAAQRSLQCFCVVGEILWKFCVVDGETLVVADMGFGVCLALF